VLTHPASLKHRAPGHPESPERILAIDAVLAQDPRLAVLPRHEPAAATTEQLERVHQPRYIDRIREAGEAADATGEGQWLDPDTWIGPGSLEAARHSAGAAVAAVQMVLAGEAQRAVSLCRPPGHHATAERAMGFCLFNNIAVGAAEARSAGYERVAIVDFDVHHGNGTQDIFYARSDVLYISCHQHPLYPGTGAVHERGIGAGEGYTVNVPLPAGCARQQYLEVFDEVFRPTLEVYRPELLLVSAGFDVHTRDPLANMRLETPDYGELARLLRAWSEELCGGRSVWTLEGGYDLDALSGSVAEVLRQLN
jgi:acetoin utilization deacetylase AcuC-like enzyme